MPSSNSSFNQAETALDPIKPGIDAIDANRNTRELNLDMSHTLRQLKHPFMQSVELLADCAQVLENQVVRFVSHLRMLAQFCVSRDRIYAISSWYCL